MHPSPTFWPPAPDLRRDEVRVSHAGREYLGHLVAPPREAGPRPLVLVIHNYQGLKFFDVDVAEYLARVGYVGLAIDMYGDLLPPEERIFPSDARAVPNFQKRCFEAMVAVDHDFPDFRGLLQTWLAAGRAHESVDASYSAAAIGYCFGGVAVLEAVRGGLDLSAVVSFHGLLQTGEDPSPESAGVKRPELKRCENSYNTGTVVLIENGANDHLVGDTSMKRFFTEMDGAGVQWIFHHHAQTPHGFALPATLGPPGRLHEASDRRSTMSMLSVFREVFPGVVQNTVACNAAGTSIPT
ncbi:MAG: dienelactone hydrolase family protein [Proteobacteria bacterium]|nr:dienelactone hydrolase family protein [Pseudomonadota bacterium]